MVIARTKIGLSAFIIACCIIITPLSAFAQTVNPTSGASAKASVRYTKKSAVIYKKMSAQSKVLGKIPKATAVTVLSTSGSWCKVIYSGKTGYIKKANLKNSDTQKDEDTQVVQKVKIVGSSNADDPAIDGERVRDKDNSGLTKLDKSKDKIQNWSNQIVLGSGGMAIPKLYQTDFKQTVCVYNGTARSVATSGCGVTCLSMVIAYLTNNMDQSPYTLFREACQNNMYKGKGLGRDALAKIAERYNVKGEWKTLKGKEIRDLLKDGVPIIAHMGEGYFTDKGHYIVLSGLTEDGKVLVNDPASRKNSAKAYPSAIFIKEKRIGRSFMVMSKTESANAETDQSTIYIVPAVSVSNEAGDVKDHIYIVPAVSELSDTGDASDTGNNGDTRDTSTEAGRIIEANVVSAEEVV